VWRTSETKFGTFRMFVPGNEVMLGNLVICTIFLEVGVVEVTIMITF